MKAFAELYAALDATTSTGEKVALMASFFRAAPAEDAAWAVFLLSGRKLRSVVKSSELRALVRRFAGLDEFVFAECYQHVGDLAETATLLIDSTRPAPTSGETTSPAAGLAEWITERIEPLRRADESQRRAALEAWFAALPRAEMFVLIKVLTGALRVGISRGLVHRALAEAFGIDESRLAQRLMGDAPPSAAWFCGLIAHEATPADRLTPRPFFLATPLETGDPESLGDVRDWQIEWKFDGIRCQLVRRGGAVALWSRGEELLTERFPEIIEAAGRLPSDCVLDGELLCLAPDGSPRPFSVLQTRITRTSISRALLARAPAGFIAYDALEAAGRDLTALALSERRRALETEFVRAHPRLSLSPVLECSTWNIARELRAQARERGAEGLMIKHRASPYGAGRRAVSVAGAEIFAWRKWKVDPYTLDVVLTAAQPGHGKRAGLFTDYTFAVWDAGALVTLAKAYSGLSNDEIVALDAWIRRHTVGRFGPVRQVEPVRVFELGFEGLAESPRHRSGLALRFPRILRERTDKPAAEADTLETARALLRHAQAENLQLRPPRSREDQPGLFGAD
ncbi:MAG: ATP-dependent DNA ligase [Planctomycetota bacterium]|nr:ATP-dependent DNA ligase [Planctomycetota bacterium]